LADQVLVRKIDVLRLKGKLEPITVYEPIAQRSQATPSQIELASRYEVALASCRAMRWDVSEETIQQPARTFPDDPPSQVMLKRIAAFREMGLSDWDGVFVAVEK